MAEYEVSLIEDHPYRHQWYKSTDYVHERNARKRLVTVKRVEECEYCDTQRITLIDVLVWERKGYPYYKYNRHQLIRRIEKADWVKREFLRTTSDEIRNELNRK